LRRRPCRPGDAVLITAFADLEPRIEALRDGA
jgi:hypothetical protein